MNGGWLRAAGSGRHSRIKRLTVIAAISVTALLGVYAGSLFYLRSETPSDDLFNLHTFLLTALVATWVVADAQELGRAHPSFDHGSFILIAFPFYVPYYLISTRRWWRGLLMLGGIVLLFTLPWLVELFVWLLEWIIWFLQPLFRLAQWVVAHVT